MFLIHKCVALTCTIQWNFNSFASTRKRCPRIHILVRFLACISKNKTRKYLQRWLFTEPRMFRLKNWKAVFSCVRLWHASLSMYCSTASPRDNSKTLTWFACLCMKYDHFKIFLQEHASFWKILANTCVSQTLTFDWVVLRVCLVFVDDQDMSTLFANALRI